jgi:hypothetical protein
MKKNIILYLLLLLCTPTLLLAQVAPFGRLHAVSILKKNHSPYHSPLIGGLECPQFNNADLNNDGLLDLVIFDRVGDVILPFINNGASNPYDAYTFAPHYIQNFPKLSSFVLLRDYNRDGLMDIFAYSQVPGIPGIEVWKGVLNTQNELTFTRTFNYLTFPNVVYFYSNIYVAYNDFPAVDDIDEDGDLDIVTFELVGSYVDYYENQQVEQGLSPDTLVYRLKSNCWGRFYEPGLSEAVVLSNNFEKCPNNPYFINEAKQSGSRHAGSTLLTIDMDNDQDKELFLGDISFDNINMLLNGRNRDTAWFVNQDNAFPSNTTPVDIATFPVLFHLDLDNDGDGDLIAAPNQDNSSENYLNNWYYTNTGTEQAPVFSFVQKDLFTDQTVDLGSTSAPCYMDVNADGKIDLLLGSQGFFNSSTNTYNATLHYYQNISANDSLQFILSNINLGGLDVLEERMLAPAAGDIDNDGDVDIVLGSDEGEIYWLQNIAGSGAPANFAAPQFFQSIDPGQASVPCIADINCDGLSDLLIAERNGNINYYQNTGSAGNPVFAGITNSFFGKIDTRTDYFPVGYASVALFKECNSLEMLVGSEEGIIKHYKINPDSLLAGGFELLSADFQHIREGRRLRLTAADIWGNDNIPEIAVTNQRGGIAFYGVDPFYSNTSSHESALLSVGVVPNPAAGYLTIQVGFVPNPTCTATVYNTLGQRLLHMGLQGTSTPIDLAGWAAGIYFLQVQQGSATTTIRFVVK